MPRTPPPGVIVRPIEPADLEQLRDGFEHLSPASRHARFLHFVKYLSDDQLRFYTEVDHHDHEAFVAVFEDTGEGLGVGRYIRSPADPDEAEVAITVADEWQRHGIGSMLMKALVERARAVGIKRFDAIMLAENKSMLHLLQAIGPVERIGYAGATLEVKLPLPGDHETSEYLKAAAEGHLTSALTDKTA